MNDRSLQQAITFDKNELRVFSVKATSADIALTEKYANRFHALLAENLSVLNSEDYEIIIEMIEKTTAIIEKTKKDFQDIEEGQYFKFHNMIT